MTTPRRMSGWATILAIAILPASASIAAAVAPIDASRLQSTTAPAVCLAMAENAWGVPLSITSAFLIGDGRFVVVDLATVAQPGVVKVTLQFQDDSTVSCGKFAVADPAIGLAVLKIDWPAAPAHVGLTLASTLPPLEGAGPYAIGGWRWGDQFDLVVGRLWKGLSAKELAARCSLGHPPDVETIIRMDAPRVECAGVSPILDSAGAVQAVHLDVAARDLTATLAMPAASLRAAMLKDSPQLRPFSDLPEPVWPTRRLRMTGDPGPAAAFTQSTLFLKSDITCPLCDGKGKVNAGSVLGGRGKFGPDVTCPRCGGDGTGVRDNTLDDLADMVEQGTRLVWSPLADDKARSTVRAGGLEVLRTLASTSQRFQGALGWAMAADFTTRTVPPPRGVILFAQVKQQVKGSDGTYLLLLPWGVGTTYVAVRLDDLVTTYGLSASVTSTEIGDGAWMVLAGTAIGRFSDGTSQGFVVLPMQWISIATPPPAPAPPRLGPGRGGRRGGQGPPPGVP